MPPKNKFTKEQLVDAAFAIAAEEGFDNITIRKVAEKLGSSIAPIYVNFKEIDELKHEVALKAIDINKELILQQNSGDSFLDIGIAAVIFAKKYPLLFDELALKNNDFYKDQTEAREFALNQMKKNPKLVQFNDEELQILLIKMQALQAGLSLLVRNERYSKILTDEMIIKILDETGNDVVNGMKQRGGCCNEV